MRVHDHRHLVAQLLVVFSIFAFAQSANAQTRSLEEGPIVRRQLLYRSDRFELEPALAHSLNDPYRRTLMLFLGANYHMTNEFAMGVNLAYGLLKYNSNLLDGIEAANPSVARQLGFAETTIQGDFHISYVPFYGKFNFLEETTINYDFHVLLGVGGALVSAGGSALAADSRVLEGLKFGPAIGAGWRFFIDGDTALTFDLIDHMFASADIQRGEDVPEETFSHNVMITVGVSFFVSGELRLSR